MRNTPVALDDKDNVQIKHVLSLQSVADPDRLTHINRHKFTDYILRKYRKLNEKFKERNKGMN